MNRYFQISSRTIKIVLLTLQSFTSGLFLAYYFTFANGVFLEKNKPEDLPLLLPLVYILSGLTGLGLAKFYSHLLTKVNTRSLFQGTLLFLLFTTSLMYFFYSTYSYLIIIMAFIALSSFYTLVGFQFWGIAFKMFDIRESKKIFGLLEMGM